MPVGKKGKNITIEGANYCIGSWYSTLGRRGKSVQLFTQEVPEN
jgi:hypothetical protein